MTQPAPPGMAGIVARLRAAGCVFAEDEASLLCAAARTPAELSAMVERRVSGLPLEHVLGFAEFCGLRIAVTPGVFVPRRRSEFLVREAAAVAAARSRPASRRDQPGGTGQPDRDPEAPVVVLDMCCGSGAVGVAVATTLGRAGLHAELHAADIDPAAVACARHNVAAAGGQVYEGDLYDPLPASLRGRVDVLVVNAPYVPTSEIAFMPPEARLHEPAIALDGGVDGVQIHRRVAAQALTWIAPHGRLLIETSDRQVPLTVAAMAAAGLAAQVARDDGLRATVVIGSARRRR